MTDIQFFPVSKTPANEKDKRKEVGTEDELPDMSKLEMVRTAVRTGSSINHMIQLSKAILWPQQESYMAFPPRFLELSQNT